MSNFSFSHSVFKRLVLQSCKNKGLFGTGLNVFSFMIDTKPVYLYRKLAEKDSNLETQMDVFDENRSNDEEQLPGAKGIDLTSPLDVFHSIFKQVGAFQSLLID